MILAGDIGGTKTQLGLYESSFPIRPIHKAIFPSQGYSGLERMIEDFIPRTGEPLSAACFGVAGPIVNGNCITTNLPWNVHSANIAALLSLKKATLLNDLEAFGYGIPLLSADEFCTLNEGEPSEGNAGIIAAGTGLGEASMIWDGKRHIPSASEGGHVDFAPRNELEIELLRYSLKQFDRVSIERLVSGPGLYHIYEFLRTAGYGKESAEIRRRCEERDPSGVVSAAALAKEDDLSIKALDLFTSLYGATAGNLALTLMATGGIYIGGGIAPKILDKLKDGTFMQAFQEKGRFSALLSRIPVRVILNGELPLLGAARVAVDSID